MRRERIRSFTAVCTVGWLVWAATASAQSGPPLADSMIQTPYDGDCVVTINLPAAITADMVRLSLDDERAELAVQLAKSQPFVATLSEPLRRGSKVIVLVRGQRTAISQVVVERPASMLEPTSCKLPQVPTAGLYDDRQTFEASAFYGRVFDNFAPAEILGANYVKPPVGDIDVRWTGGFQVGLRLLGDPDAVRQLWLSTQTLHGARSADIDCEKNPSSPNCPKDATGRVFSAIEHADTMEAHVEARLELFRLQARSDTPVKVFASTRFGFVAMSGAPKVFSSDAYVGGGVVAPKGAFRGSFAEIAWGRSRQFQSAVEANRLKVYGTLVFDVMPGLIGQAQNILSQAGSSTRAFVAIVVDRNPGGTAPDAIQTYVGVAFDVRRLVGAF